MTSGGREGRKGDVEGDRGYHGLRWGGDHADNQAAGRIMREVRTGENRLRVLWVTRT